MMIVHQDYELKWSVNIKKQVGTLCHYIKIKLIQKPSEEELIEL